MTYWTVARHVAPQTPTRDSRSNPQAMGFEPLPKDSRSNPLTSRTILASNNVNHYHHCCNGQDNNNNENKGPPLPMPTNSQFPAVAANHNHTNRTYLEGGGHLLDNSDLDNNYNGPLEPCNNQLVGGRTADDQG